MYGRARTTLINCCHVFWQPSCSLSVLTLLSGGLRGCPLPTGLFFWKYGHPCRAECIFDGSKCPFAVEGSTALCCLLHSRLHWKDDRPRAPWGSRPENICQILVPPLWGNSFLHLRCSRVTCLGLDYAIPHYWLVSPHWKEQHIDFVVKNSRACTLSSLSFSLRLGTGAVFFLRGFRGLADEKIPRCNET